MENLTEEQLNTQISELINDDIATEDEVLDTINLPEAEKALALALHLELTLSELDNIENPYDDTFTIGGNREWLVYTDSEADNAWDESIDNYIEECIEPELEKIGGNLMNYFDYDRFKRDCSIDGRGHQLSTYDGVEYFESVNGTTYYIYRTN